MRIRKPGKITDGLWLLGKRESCVYLLEGNRESMIVSGGMSYILPDLLEQFRAFDIDTARISRILILHSHFDHVGIIPFFKRQWPEIDIYASSRAWELLSMPRTIETINRFSREVAAKMGRERIYETLDPDWDNEITGKTLSDMDTIDLGDLKGCIHETRGHSSCSISLYVPRLRALFPSDSGGIPYEDTVIVSGNSDFTKYQESLEKLNNLDVGYYCADHYGYITGEESENFISRCIVSARNYRSLIEKIYKRSGNIDKAAKELSDLFNKEGNEYFLTDEIMEGVYRQMIRHIAENMEDSVISG